MVAQIGSDELSESRMPGLGHIRFSWGKLYLPSRFGCVDRLGFSARSPHGKGPRYSVVVCFIFANYLSVLQRPSRLPSALVQWYVVCRMHVMQVHWVNKVRQVLLCHWQVSIRMILRLRPLAKPCSTGVSACTDLFGHSKHIFASLRASRWQH